MQVRIVKAGCDRTATSIDNLRCVTDQRGDVVVTADVHTATNPKRTSFGKRLLLVNGNDMSVQHDQIGRRVVGASKTDAK